MPLRPVVAARIEKAIDLYSTRIINMIPDVAVVGWITLSYKQISVSSDFEYADQLAVNVKLKLPVALYSFSFGQSDRIKTTPVLCVQILRPECPHIIQTTAVEVGSFITIPQSGNDSYQLLR